jgi:hypothetical protein
MSSYDWVKIQDRSRFVKKIEQHHPDSRKYLPYWKSEKKKIIEGAWIYDNGGWRYMPPKLYFAANHGSMLVTDHINKKRTVTRPYLTTLFWELGYISLITDGFSGFTESNITCNHAVLELKKNWNNINSKKHINMFKRDGTFKEYVPPLEFVKNLQHEELGLPLYENDMCNYMLLGSRGSGKSWFLANAELAHPLITDGAIRYDSDSINNPNQINVLVGSSDATKSSALAQKVQDIINELGTSPDLGVWSEWGQDDYTPSVLYRDFMGSIEPNNRSNPYRAEYKTKINGRELSKGSKSQMHHIIFSHMAQGGRGAMAAASGRYRNLVWDECGLSSLVKEAHKSNEATIMTDGIIMGKICYAGTSESMEQIQPTKEMFTNPKDYRLLEFEDVAEKTGSTAFFIPAEVVLFEAMDDHGNVDMELAKHILDSKEAEKAKSKNPDILRSWRLNYPRIISHMWAYGNTKLLPYEESALREKELMTNGLYHKIGKCIKLTWDSNSTYGVKYDIVYDATPVFNYPITNATNLEGAVVVYDFPQYINGQIPDDMYIYTHDPYIADDLDKGGSLGCTQVWLNPKYFNEYMIGSPLVAVYLGKHSGGKKQYYETQEKLLSMYGNCPQMLYYEANRGEDCYYHYLAKGKVGLLCPRPTSSDSMFQETTRKFGFMMSNRLDKLNHIASLHDLLLSKIVVDKVNGIDKTFISTIPDIYLVREIMAYNLDDNFDAISATLGYVIAIRELEKFKKNEIIDKNVQRNKLSFLSVNPNMFKQQMDMRNKY